MQIFTNLFCIKNFKGQEEIFHFMGELFYLIGCIISILANNLQDFIAFIEIKSVFQIYGHDYFICTFFKKAIFHNDSFIGKHKLTI